MNRTSLTVATQDTYRKHAKKKSKEKSRKHTSQKESAAGTSKQDDGSATFTAEDYNDLRSHVSSVRTELDEVVTSTLPQMKCDIAEETRTLLDVRVLLQSQHM